MHIHAKNISNAITQINIYFIKNANICYFKNQPIKEKLKYMNFKQINNAMPDTKRAERIKNAILNTCTYEKFEELSQINIGTLRRITGGKRDIYIDELIKVSELTSSDPIYLAFGNEDDAKEMLGNYHMEESENKNFRTAEAIHTVAYNFRVLDEHDKKMIARLVMSLARDTINSKMIRKELNADEIKELMSPVK